MRTSKHAPRIPSLLVCASLVWFCIPTAGIYPAHNKEAAENKIVLWHDPGPVEMLDLAGGPGGAQNAPQPPFTFIEELKTGVTPKVKVRDGAGRLWVAKWGSEGPAQTFSSRMAWAAGYFAAPTYFVKSGRISGAHGLERARRHVKKGGQFKNAGFEWWVGNLVKNRDWSWRENPFDDTPDRKRELNGLKIIVMLTSNWDVKNSGTAIMRDSSDGSSQDTYFVIDWGGSMGRWGEVSHDKWDCKGYARQTPDFVTGVKHGSVRWGFQSPVNNHNITKGITVEDVAWLLSYLGRITDDQLRAGLEASGAEPKEVECFARAIRRRIDQLEAVVRKSGDD
jgi:hypothetical protein